MRTREQPPLNLSRSVHFLFEAAQILTIGLHKPQEPPDASHQFASGKWLRYVIVRAEIETVDAITFLRFRGKENDRRLQTGAPKLAANLEPVFAGKHNVEQDEIERFLERAHARANAVGDDFHLITFEAERVFQSKRDTRLVFDD